MFARYDSKGKLIRNRVVVDCSGDEILTEQNHKDEANINSIVKRHGMDLIRKTAQLSAPDMQWDDVTGNDFQEAMFKVTKAQQTFDQLPSELRSKFDNNPAKFLDFVQNPENGEKMVEYGLANKPVPETVTKVEVINNVGSSETVDKGIPTPQGDKKVEQTKG